jgi:hypothetical protein
MLGLDCYLARCFWEDNVSGYVRAGLDCRLMGWFGIVYYLL